MSVELVALGTVQGVEVHHPPVGGVVRDRNSLLRLEGADVAWRMPVDGAPPFAVSGRRLYVGFGEWLVCLDAKTGAEVWGEECAGLVAALHAHPGGVDALVGPRVLAFDPRGVAGPPVAMGRTGSTLLRVGAIRYVGADDGIWRLVPGERPALLYACASPTLYDRDGAFRALAVGPPGTVLVEDDGMPLVWPFADAEAHLIAPWGLAEWAVVPREGRGGLWVVDHRVQTRWKVPLPGRATALAVADTAVAVALDDRGPVLAVIHRDVAEPLLLAIDGADALHARGDHLFLTHAGSTMIFVVREA